MELRDYQEECVRLVLAEYQQNKSGDALLVLPTGAGKTVIFSHVIHYLAREYGLNTLIIAHRDELLDQAADKYRQINPEAIIGKVGSGMHQYGGEVTVASIATVSRAEHLRKLKAIGYGLIIIDEAHHSAAAGYQKVLKTLPGAFVLLVTATPDRLDGKLIQEKPPLYQASIIDMIQRKYLSDVKAIAIRTEISLDAIRTQMGDFHEQELDRAVNTLARNKRVVQAYQEYTPGQRAICFAVTVAHAQALATTFNEADIPTAVVTGNTPIDARKLLYEAFHAGEILVLCNVQVLTEGFDEPLIECVIMARPTQSRSLYVQAIGRGLRLADGKSHCTILDLTDNCFKHRLQPQSLSKALGKFLKNNETVEQSLAREKTEREAQARRLSELRLTDLQINILEKIEWKKLDTGTHVLELPRINHRIAIVPGKHDKGKFFVAARLAPTFKVQYWSGEQSIEDCQMLAEKRALQLLNDPSARALVDKDAGWRSKLIDPHGAQVKKMERHHISWHVGMTKGEASDLIDKHLEDVKKQNAEKAARKAEKLKQQYA